MASFFVISPQVSSKTVTKYYLFNCICNHDTSYHVGHGKVIISHRIMWDIITYPRPIYLLLLPNSCICSVLWTILSCRKSNLRLPYRTTTGSLFTERTTSNLEISWSSKPRDSALDCSNRSEIWQTSRQQRCRDVCHILERCDDYVIQSPDLASRCLN